LAEEALPKVLTTKSMLSLVKEELKRHHRWMGVVFHYSDKFPRVYRVMSLATSIVVMLFVQSITYNLTNGDDGTCERLETEVSCLEPSSAYATGESKCYWSVEASGPVGGQCLYVQPSDSIKVVLFVAVFSAIAGTPLALLADMVITKVLAAPVVSAMPSLGRKKLASFMSIAPAPAPASSSAAALTAEAAGQQVVLNRREALAVNREAVVEDVNMDLVKTQYVSLVHGLKRHLSRLQGAERAEFKGECKCSSCVSAVLC